MSKLKLSLENEKTLMVQLNAQIQEQADESVEKIIKNE